MLELLIAYFVIGLIFIISTLSIRTYKIHKHKKQNKPKPYFFITNWEVVMIGVFWIFMMLPAFIVMFSDDC